jgi:hypothetical protein
LTEEEGFEGDKLLSSDLGLTKEDVDVDVAEADAAAVGATSTMLTD